MRVPAADAHCSFGINIHDRIFNFLGNLGEGVGKFNGGGHGKGPGAGAARKTFGRTNPVGNHRANENSDPQGYGNHQGGQSPPTACTHLNSPSNPESPYAHL